MGSSYWGIEGFGINLENCQEFFNFKSLREDVEEGFVYEDFSDFFSEELLSYRNEQFTLVQATNGANADTGSFVMLYNPTAVVFYQEDKPETFTQLTWEEAGEKIYEFVKPYLAEGITKEMIIEQCYHISTYGCG